MSSEVTMSPSEQKTEGAVSRARRIGFYVAGGLFLLLCLAFFGLFPDPPILPLIVTGWFQPEALGSHQLHETLASGLFWSIVAGMIFTVAQSGKMISALRQTLAILLMMILLLLASGNLMEPAMMMSILLVVAGITAVLHPARHRLLRLQDGVQPWLLVLVAGAAVPLLGYAFGQLEMQIGATAADEHAQFGHWALMSGYALSIVLCGLLASAGASGWRVPAWSAGIMAVLFGLATVVLQGQASSTGLTWGLLSIAWGLVFMAAAEILKNRKAPTW